MTLVGALAILVGWLLISLYAREAPPDSTARSRRRTRMVLAVVGASILALGLVAVVEARY